jgi:F/Y-rich N-terminus
MRKVVEIPKDEDGKPILPIQIGSFQLISIGKVELRDGYYNERYIWPVGYCIKRYEVQRRGRYRQPLNLKYLIPLR